MRPPHDETLAVVTPGKEMARPEKPAAPVQKVAEEGTPSHDEETAGRARARQVKAELAKIRKQGYATDNEEYIDGLIAVAVPIFDPNGGFYAGLALHAPEARMKLKDAVTKLPSLQATAKRISELMRTGPG